MKLICRIIGHRWQYTVFHRKWVVEWNMEIQEPVERKCDRCKAVQTREWSGSHHIEWPSA